MNDIKTKDIVNKDVRNITNCESEPIHIPGSIQPHGFLLGVKEDGLLIDYCSNNSNEYLAIENSASLLGKRLDEIFDANEVAAFERHINIQDHNDVKPFSFTINGIGYNVSFYKTGKILVLELEPFPDGSMNVPDLYAQTKKFVSFLQETTGLQHLCQVIAEEIRNIIGYDRVMIYRFDEQYNGEVYAESKREDLEPFLGLHYPHTDIPAQARQLYLTNLLRVIADVNYKPVPILTIDDGTDKTLDMSVSVLRSVSPIHIEYLQNMGVSGTLTISLVHDQKLWGLVACHHYSARLIPHFTRLAAQLQAHFLTSQVKVRETAEDYEIRQRSDKYQKKLQALLTSKEEFLSKVHETPALAKLVNADGVAVIANGDVYSYGDVPAKEDMLELGEWCQQYCHAGRCEISSLYKLYPKAEKIKDTAAGIIYHTLNQVGDDCIIWFRHEVEKNINWAGKPTTAEDSGAKSLTPRKSFALWKESVSGTSEHWREPETNAAANFAHDLQKQFHLSFAEEEERRYRLLNTKLKAVNDELENVNWISTHDLKEPLRKIQIFASKVMELEKDSISSAGYKDIGRMKKSAERMQKLIDDILSYSRLGRTETVFAKCDLNKILEEVNDELKDNFATYKATLTSDRLPVIEGIEFQLQQVFMNLILNALKFSKPDVTPHVKVTCKVVNNSDLPEFSKEQIFDKYYQIDFADNGIGFDPEHTDKIFNVFQRLHTSHEYKGTGVGLAICKKILQNHNGFITAVGEEGKGATFTIFLPVTEA